MSIYQIYCSACEVEYSIQPIEDIKDIPCFCAYCSSEIDESNIREEEYIDEEEESWNKLSEESLDELDDWKE